MRLTGRDLGDDGKPEGAIGSLLAGDEGGVDHRGAAASMAQNVGEEDATALARAVELVHLRVRSAPVSRLHQDRRLAQIPRPPAV